ncbi:sensor domain-containing diguanylate cyclase [Coxiella burnetii]|uniref:diguanylate cyclase n=1 Tax=Coxiella burnetii (strain RSA 493 / Nine Mile phase I) TaxID=227377 RepID=Q83A76_COXBU|nr:sensor domain-containing diguanylate cyclase [Coxiella burnetii]NP_821005.1 GGDEF family protein [Coxiella burnetii RSA 493]AAO91519.1 GGDEF family protein [Coxiella burnetii RSA 493]ARI66777.1 sensor domain-containing diguanylate cyclase [Coxiella burnetii]ARK28209.1 sensor domain-containing diguanylate cyclase [Coxiella burnetii]OYK83398.1 sensor domain-containing diguanylate cyclase [Coxiella burnetii]OYK87215.1 sensor domain-containing diguanylate cyclase [Coxiella burnetii]
MVSVQQKKLQLLFSHISELIISPYKVDTVIEKIMEEVENFFTPTNWSLLRYDSVDDELFFVYAKGLDEEIIKGIRLKRGEGIAGTVAETGKSLFIRDCQNDPRFSKKVDRSFKQKTRSIITVPIKFKDVLLGVLELVNLENNVYFSEEDCFLLEIVANFSAVALINASLFENVVTLSHHDPLTGAYNRTKLEELLKKWEKASAVYAEKKISVFLLDLNNFKAVNDNYGHRAGDQLLKKNHPSYHFLSPKKGSVF